MSETNPKRSRQTDPKLIPQSGTPGLAAESERISLESGWIEKIFGSPKNAPFNLAFLVLVLTFAAGFVFTIAFPADRMEFWKLIAPTITLTIGYVIGRSSQSSNANTES